MFLVMKNYDSKLRKSLCGNNRINFPNTLHAARSRISRGAGIQSVTNMVIRGISAGITAVRAAPVSPLAAVPAPRRRTPRQRRNRTWPSFQRSRPYRFRPSEMLTRKLSLPKFSGLRSGIDGYRRASEKRLPPRLPMRIDCCRRPLAR
jgi:hypothetical protein